MTNSSILTYITLQFDRKDLQFQLKDGMQKATVNIYGRITSMARKRGERSSRTPSPWRPSPKLSRKTARASSIYNKAILLPPGMYRLNIVAKDVVGGNMTNYEMKPCPCRATTTRRSPPAR